MTKRETSQAKEKLLQTEAPTEGGPQNKIPKVAGLSKEESQPGEKESPQTNKDPAKSADATKDELDSSRRRSKRIAERVAARNSEIESPQSSEDPAGSAEEDEQDILFRRSKRIAEQPKKENDSKKRKRVKPTDPIYVNLDRARQNLKKNKRLGKARSDDELNQGKSSKSKFAKRRRVIIDESENKVVDSYNS